MQFTNNLQLYYIQLVFFIGNAALHPLNCINDLNGLCLKNCWNRGFLMDYVFFHS